MSSRRVSKAKSQFTRVLRLLPVAEAEKLLSTANDPVTKNVLHAMRDLLAAWEEEQTAHAEQLTLFAEEETDFSAFLTSELIPRLF